MALGLEDLWSQILWCAAQGPGLVRNFLGESKVCDDDVAFSIQENVFRLEVSVDNTERVEVGEGADNLGREKQNCVFRKSFSFSEVRKQLSAAYVGKQEVELATVFGATQQRDEEWVADFLELIMF